MKCDRAWLMLRRLGVLVGLVSLVGCGDEPMADLDAFMAEQREKPSGVIEPAPSFILYEPFAYAASVMRSPFDRPSDAQRLPASENNALLRPDQDRLKETLEGFDFDSLQMVGLLARGSQIWALIKDPESGIHRVKVGNFIGRDHGRVVRIGVADLAVIEIVPDGTYDGWVERPRTLQLSEN